MSRESRRLKSDSELGSLEREFERRLVAALESCAGGYQGLFEGNSLESISLETARRRPRTEAAELLRLCDEIAALRGGLGITGEHWLCERFKHYRAMTDGNAPGEPKRARLLLKEIAERRPAAR